MKLIVGLGNPGNEYAKTRHNAGFILIDMLVDQLGGTWQHKGKYEMCRCDDTIYVKPHEYMNLSGTSVAYFSQFYKIPAYDILVLHDEIDLPSGERRVKFGGSSGGHNGLKDIIKKLGTEKFRRIRLGVGRPLSDTVSRVLGKLSVDEINNLQSREKFSLIRESYNREYKNLKK